MLEFHSYRTGVSFLKVGFNFLNHVAILLEGRGNTVVKVVGWQGVELIELPMGELSMVWLFLWSTHEYG